MTRRCCSRSSRTRTSTGPAPGKWKPTTDYKDVGGEDKKVSQSMGLGTKNRQKQTAERCKRHLREKYRDQAGLVEEFIGDFEGTGKNCDLTKRGAIHRCEGYRQRDAP